MKKSFIIAITSFTTYVALTTLTQAAGTAVNDAAAGIGNLGALINGFTGTVVKAVGTLFLSGAVVAFFYGIVQYIWGLREGQTEKVKNGNKFMGYGLLALFVMFSVYGIIKWGQDIIGLKDVDKITIPEINFIKGTSGGSATGGTGGTVITPGGSANGGTGGSAGSDGLGGASLCELITDPSICRRESCFWEESQGVCR